MPQKERNRNRRSCATKIPILVARATPASFTSSCALILPNQSTCEVRMARGSNESTQSLLPLGMALPRAESSSSATSLARSCTCSKTCTCVVCGWSLVEQTPNPESEHFLDVDREVAHNLITFRCKAARRSWYFSGYKGPVGAFSSQHLLMVAV